MRLRTSARLGVMLLGTTVNWEGVPPLAQAAEAPADPLIYVPAAPPGFRDLLKGEELDRRSFRRKTSKSPGSAHHPIG
jgi:hypothetical protein